LSEIELTKATDTFEPLAYDERGVFGGVEQNATGLGDGEVT
jgi:hypothetical protein